MNLQRKLIVLIPIFYGITLLSMHDERIQKAKDSITREIAYVNPETGATHLMYAAASNQRDANQIITTYLQRGALVNQTDNQKRTALMYVFLPNAKPHTIADITKTLLHNSADANLVDSQGQTALIKAFIKIKIEEKEQKELCSAERLTCGCRKEIVIYLEEKYSKPIKLLLKKMNKEAINVQEHEDPYHPKTALMHAAEICVPNFTQMLLEAGADPAIFYTDSLGNKFNALRFARIQTNCTELVKLLEEKTMQIVEEKTPETAAQPETPVALSAPQAQTIATIPQTNFLSQFALYQRLRPYIQRCIIL